jgi:menaquinone-dependent protoporphyrinogen IX oxidase
MKKIFIYFSNSGNGEAVASFLKDHGYDTLRIETQKPLGHIGFFKMMHYGRLATFEKETPIKPITFNENDYDKIVLGSPVWADKLSTPMNAFLAHHPFQKEGLVFLLYSGGGSSEKTRKQIAKTSKRQRAAI